MNDKEKIKAIKEVYEDYEKYGKMIWTDESKPDGDRDKYMNSERQIRKIVFSD
jgi:hypothetical protein